MGALLGGGETVIWTKEGGVEGPFFGKSMEMDRPSPISPTLREKLSIFGREDNVRSPVVISFDQQNSYSKYLLPVSMEFEELSNVDNYKVIPLGVLHHLFLFLRPKDLVKLFMTCKYFNKAGFSNLFWKRYYVHFFDLDSKEIGNNLNYKKQFFKRFSDCRCADQYYRSSQKPIILTEENEEDNKERGFVFNDGEFTANLKDKKGSVVFYLDSNHRYTICGPSGIGKRSLLLRLWKNDFDLDSENGYPQNELTGNSTFRFTCIKPWNLRRSHCDTLGKEEMILQYYDRGMRRVDIVSDPAMLKRNDTDNSLIFCFVCGERKSFEEIKKFIESTSDILGRSVPKKQRKRGILVGLKSDLFQSKSQIKEYEIRRVVEKYLLKGYIECSAKENTNCYLPFGVLVSKKTWRVMRVGGHKTAL